MAHEVEKMFFVGETPWHGLGHRLEAAPTSAEAIKCAGLDWAVETVPLVTSDTTAPVPAVATRRVTDGSILGVVGTGYKPLQNTEAFGFFDPFLAAGEASLHTAGSLRNGRRVWVLAKINRAPSVILPGDEVEKYVLLSNSHDGTLAVRVGFTPIRVVCANTMALAHGSEGSKLIRIRHSGNVVAALDEVRNVMNTANQNFEATAEQFRRMARRGCNEDDLKKYVQRVFPAVNVDVPGRSRVLESIQRLCVEGRGAERPGVRGTYWGAYNAITEHLAYERGRSPDSRLDNLWFGDGANLNARALEVAIEAVAA